MKRVNYVAQRAAQRLEQAAEAADKAAESGATDAAATADTVLACPAAPVFTHRCPMERSAQN